MSEKQAKNRTVQSLIGEVDALMQWFVGRDGIGGGLTNTDCTRPAGAEVQNMTDPDELRQLLWTLQQFVHAVSNELLVLTDDEPAELELERVR
jgi:hypothetical protein